MLLQTWHGMAIVLLNSHQPYFLHRSKLARTPAIMRRQMIPRLHHILRSYLQWVIPWEELSLSVEDIPTLKFPCSNGQIILIYIWKAFIVFSGLFFKKGLKLGGLRWEDIDKLVWMGAGEQIFFLIVHMCENFKIEEKNLKEISEHTHPQDG